MDSQESKKEIKKFNWRKVFKIVTPLWFIGVILLMFFLLGTHQVSGESMEPTFQNLDRILVVKHLSPQREDIITFTPESDPTTSYVKRVVGLPGDYVLLRGNTLYLIPKEESMPEVPDNVWEPTNLPDSTQVIEVEQNVATILFNYENIPENYYFVEGDNRNHSTDSRSFGWISADQIEGVVKFRYYPFPKVGIIS